MTPENVALLIDTLGAIAIIGMIGGFAIWSDKHVSKDDGKHDD